MLFLLFILAGDPRLSIEERYKDQADYVERVSHAARSLMSESFLLPEDADELSRTQ